jgi:hypothetical protein
VPGIHSTAAQAGGGASPTSSFSLADWPVYEDMEEDEDEVVDTSTPLHDQAAVLQADALTARQLRATLTQAGEPSGAGAAFRGVAGTTVQGAA